MSTTFVRTSETKDAAAKPKPPQRSRQKVMVVLRVNSDGTVLLIHSLKSQELAKVLPLAVQADQSPELILQKAVDLLKQGFVDQPAHAFWRLVLPGGFYNLTQRPPGRWTKAMAQACSAELEQYCPLALEEVIAATLPVGERTVWTAALPEKTIEQWLGAARTLGIPLEGIWTAPSAAVEHLLENPISMPVNWCGGGILLIAQPCQESSASKGFEAIRVTAVKSACADLSPSSASGLNDGDGPEVPSAFQPALWVSQLQRIDPSESFNLLRDDLLPVELVRRRQLPLARGLWFATLGLLILGLGFLLRAHQQQNQQLQATGQIKGLWQSVFGKAPLPAMPVQSMSKQVSSWRNLQERGMLGRKGDSQLQLLNQWISALPEDLKVDIDRIRSSGGEGWLSGRVRTQADARTLFESLAKMPGVGTDSIRTSATSGSLVSFSVHLTFSAKAAMSNPQRNEEAGSR